MCVPWLRSDEFDYRLYDPIKKKLIRSRDVLFVEETIIDIEKIYEPKSKYNDNLIYLSSASLTQPSTQIKDEVYNEQFFLYRREF